MLGFWEPLSVDPVPKKSTDPTKGEGGATVWKVGCKKPAATCVCPLNQILIILPTATMQSDQKEE